MKPIILASASPRRKEIMGMLKVPFEVIPSNAQEILNNQLPIPEQIMDVAYQKAQPVFLNHPDCLVIGCDTVVVVDNEILGKPHSKDQARKMLEKLSGKTHQVVSGICMLSDKDNIRFADITEVTFNEISEDEIEAYINTSEPYDKAGGYAIQGYCARFIRGIHGNYYNVVGLSIDLIYQRLKEMGYEA